MATNSCNMTLAEIGRRHTLIVFQARKIILFVGKMFMEISLNQQLAPKYSV